MWSQVEQPKLLEIVNLKSAGNEMEMFGTKDIDDMSGIIDEDLFHLSINDLQVKIVFAHTILGVFSMLDLFAVLDSISHL